MSCASEGEDQADAFAVLESLVGSIEAPADFAAEHDHYIYGTPKRADPSERDVT